MKKSLAATSVAVVVLVAGSVPASARPAIGSGRPGCRVLYTIPMAQRAARAVYAGKGSTIPRKALRVLRILERCQRLPASRRYVRWYYNHERSRWLARIAPPTTPSGIVAEAAGDFGVPAALLWYVYGRESTWGQNPAGAGSCYFGLIYASECDPSWGLDQDADSAASVLARLYRQTGSWNGAAVAYSGGGYGWGG